MQLLNLSLYTHQVTNFIRKQKPKSKKSAIHVFKH